MSVEIARRAVPYEDIPAGFQLVPMTHEAGGFLSITGPYYMNMNAAEGVFHWGFFAEPHHCNPSGFIHGGMLATFVDIIMGGAAFMKVGAPVATITLNTEFMSAGKPGFWYDGVAEVVRKARTLCFVKGEVRCGDKLILTSSGTWAIIGAGK